MKKFLVSQACGFSFIVGTIMFALPTWPATITGFVLYVVGYILMDYYRNLK